MNNKNQVPNEFYTKLELLKIAYKIKHINLTRDRTNLLMQSRGLRKEISYSSKWKARTQGGKQEEGHEICLAKFGIINT
jgi:hypothetical protein